MSYTTHACLEVFGSFDPADLTALLGVDAKTKRAGDVLPVHRVVKEDSWHYKTRETKSDEWLDEHEWSEHVEQVLALVRPHRDEFLRFCDDRRLERDVHVVAYSPGSNQNGVLTAAHVAEVGSLGCGLYIDL